ncbi:MAG: DEAD/DEAH box helicase [Candidatus Pacebacteria bacterium]|nr:DEAD/DEAH box helicase [Candidatus Paceibacterota bacterium]
MEHKKTFSRGASSSARPRTGGASSPRSYGSSRPRTDGASSSRSYSSSRPASSRTYGSRPASSSSARSYSARPASTSSSSAVRPASTASTTTRVYPAKPRPFSARPPLGRSFSASRGGSSRGGGKRGARKGQHIDINKFINKTVITEEAVVYTPEHLFKDFVIDERLKANILGKGYNEPTPIQDRVIAHILHGHDVVGIANTGTGKTAAFLIPLIDKVLKNPKEKVIVLAPTRELAQQIEMELKGFVKGFKIFSVCCVGGAPIGRQISDLRYQHNFIIGTPGRVKDLIERKLINLADFKSAVLDEADRMLDMGFIHDMRYMMDLMPKDRHTLFFSATLSPEIAALIKDFLKEPVMVSVKTQDTSKNVEQDVVKIKAGEDKLEVLHDLLIDPEFKKVIIFGRTKHGVEKLAVALNKKGFKAQSIHGDKNQGQRQRALDTFKKGLAQILVATDVAARGLDISGVSHVINYDIPETYDDYVHRIGRTGRAGQKGKALTFIG